MVAIERGKVLGVADGYRDPEAGEPTSRRKASYAASITALGCVESALQSDVARLDTQFATWREKMAQFVAVATNGYPIPLPPTEPRQAWLQQIWRGFHIGAETRSMYAYLNTVMSASDRLYLLAELIENLIGETPEHRSCRDSADSILDSWCPGLTPWCSVLW